MPYSHNSMQSALACPWGGLVVSSNPKIASAKHHRLKHIIYMEKNNITIILHVHCIYHTCSSCFICCCIIPLVVPSYTVYTASEGKERPPVDLAFVPCNHCISRISPVVSPLLHLSPLALLFLIEFSSLLSLLLLLEGCFNVLFSCHFALFFAIYL